MRNHMDVYITLSSGLHDARHVDRISKETISWHCQPYNTCLKFEKYYYK